MKLRLLIGISLLASASLFACSHPQTKGYREPSGIETNYLRVGTYSLSPENTLVLIGIDQSFSTDPNLKTVDATQQGFKSNQDITHLEPKYLLTVSKEGIQQVYTFEIGPKKADKPDHIKSQLPYLLLDLHKWRLELLTRDPVDVGLQIADYISSLLYIDGSYSIWSNIGITHEGARRAQSSYLEQIIAQTLDQSSFPELMNAVPNANWSSELEDLGAALTIRYHLNSLYTGTIQSSDPLKRDALYRTLRANMVDQSDRQISALDMRANAECLDVERVSTTLALLEFQKDHYKDCIAYNGHELDLKGNPQEIVDKIPDLKTDDRGRIPLALYILNDQDQFVELIDFTNPDKLRDKDLLEKIHEVGISLAELVAPTVSAGAIGTVALGGLALKYTDNSIMFEVQRHGSTILKQRVEGYADLLMMMETGITTYNFDGLVKDSILANLTKAKMPDDQFQQIKTGFASSDQQVVQRTMDDALIFLGDREKGDRGFSGGAGSEAKSDSIRNARWIRFAQWMSNSKNTSKIDQQLTARADSEELKTAQKTAKEQAKEQAEAEGKPTGNWFTRLLHLNKKTPSASQEANQPTYYAAVTSPVGVHAASQAPVSVPIPMVKVKIPYALPSTDPSADPSSEPSSEPSMIPVATSPDPSRPRPVIMFMIDGFRPDRVHLAADRGQIPNIKARFIDRGVQLNSYTNYSVSLPSWTTVMTGYEPDRHGVHSSSTATRNPDMKTWTNLLDFRPDTHFYVFGKESRLYKRLVETKVRPIQEYIDPSEVLISAIPVSNVGSIPVGAAFKSLLTQYQRIAFGTLGIDPLLDLAGGNYVQQQIQQFPGKHRLVMMWFGGVDHSAHADNHSMFDSYRAIDTAIGEVLAAAKKDPVLKDAVVMLFSDHGEMGGEEVADPTRKPIPDAYFLNNSTFNVMQFFTGDLPDSRDYNFVASSSKAEEPLLDAGTQGWLMNNIWEPYFFTYHGQQKNKGRKGYHNNTTILTEPFGDAMAHILFLEPDSRKNPGKRLSYYQLTHYPAPTHPGVQLDIVHDLLNHVVYNTEWDDAIKQRLKDYSQGGHAVKFLAVPLQGANALASAVKITGGDPSQPPTREPIVVLSQGGKAGLILTRDTDDNETSMRYVPIKNFDQAPDGTISGQAVMDPSIDPFGYGNEGVTWDPLPWKTDREWLSLLQNTSWPTAIGSLPRKINYHKDVANIPNLQDEEPDIELEAGYGFTFNSFQMHEGDHGGLTPEVVHTSFFVSDDQMPPGLIQVKTPIFNRDMGMTVLDYLGKTPDPGVEGRSMKAVIENAVEQKK